MKGLLNTVFKYTRDPDLIAMDAGYHDLCGPLYIEIFATGSAPHPYLLHQYMLNSARNEAKLKEFGAIQAAFKNAAIEMVPIKGMSLLQTVYNNAGLRHLEDIDILVKKDDLSRSEKILGDAGYKPAFGTFSRDYYLHHHCHIPFYGKGLVELHWGLAQPKPNLISMPEIWKRTITAAQRDTILLSPEDDILAIALHLRRYNMPLSLKYIYDIYMIINAHKENIDWDYILRHSRSNRMTSLIYYILKSMSMLLEYQLKSEIAGRFYPGIIRACLLKCLIKMTKRKGVARLRRSMSFRKKLYILLRWLLYDQTLDFIGFIISMPVEEFCRFHDIAFPSKKAFMLYRIRFIVMLIQTPMR